MTKKENANTTNTAVADKATVSSIQPGTYTPDEICEVSEPAFKVMPEVVTGALQYKYGDSKDRYTKAEVKEAIAAFKNKEVK